MTPKVASDQYVRQQQISVSTAAAVRRLALQVGPEFDAGWRRVAPRVVETLELGRAASVHAAYGYTSAVLAETRQVGVPVGVLQPSAFLEYAPNGLSVRESVDVFPSKAKAAVARGATSREALALSAAWLVGSSLTMLADTRRDVFQADIIQRPTVTGYTRMLNPPSCGRCAVLAGKWFRWNKGFQRHPRCDCIHIPASEQVSGDLRTDPYEYFFSLSEKDQAALFGKFQSQAIRDGGDVYRVMNEGRLKSVGDGMVRRNGKNVRTLESLYRRDSDRRFVVENLRYHGYITGPQTAGGNIIGNLNTDARVLAGGRGIGTYRVGGQLVQTGRASRHDAVVAGVRDPLNRATMTAAERRLYDAHYREMWARLGFRPNTVGANSADRGLGLRPITPQERRDVAARWAAEYRAAVDPAQPSSTVRELAVLLTTR